MSSIFTQPGFINSYLIHDMEEDIIRNNPFVCNLCKGFCREECQHIIRLGNYFHHQGLDAREFDIEMECGGKSVKAWIHSLELLSMKILGKRIKLHEYCKMLITEGLISLEQSVLNCKENYTFCLQYYYYIKPTLSILQKKMKFGVKKLMVNREDNMNRFECPICITVRDVEEKINFQCSHSVCNTCFHSYIDSLKTGVDPKCGLCRSDVKEVFVKKEDYLCCIKKKYL